jgi:hypothetical protein
VITDPEKAVYEDEDGSLVVVLDLPAAEPHDGDEADGVDPFPGREAGLKEYVIPDVSTRTGRWLARIAEGAEEARRRVDAGEDSDEVYADLHLDKERTARLYERLLRRAYDEMEADEVPDKLSKHAGQIVYAWVAGGLEAARNVYEAGPGDAPKGNRQERRAQGKKAGKKKAVKKKTVSGSRPSASGAQASTTS